MDFKDFDRMLCEKFLVPAGQTFHDLCPTCVYVIRSGTDGPVKIGKAKDPSFRLADLQCASVIDLFLLAVVPINGSALSVEKTAHALAKPYRIRGEWFNLQPLEAIKYIRDAVAACDYVVWPLEETMRQARLAQRDELHRLIDEDEEERRRVLRRKLGME